MVDTEYSADDNKFSKNSIGEILKKPEMLRVVPAHSKTK